VGYEESPSKRRKIATRAADRTNKGRIFYNILPISNRL
jgi:hypothetical protein